MINKTVLKKYEEALSYCIHCMMEIDIRLVEDPILSQEGFFDDSVYEHKRSYVEKKKVESYSWWFDQISLLCQSKLSQFDTKIDFKEEIQQNLYTIGRTDVEYLYLNELNQFCEQIFFRVGSTSAGSVSIMDWGAGYLSHYSDVASIQTSIAKLQLVRQSLADNSRYALSVVKGSLVYKNHIDQFKFIEQLVDKTSLLRNKTNHESASLTIQEPDKNEKLLNLQWKGDKSDLAELIWALFKSERISDPKTGQAVTQAELIRQVEAIFGVKLDVTGLMKGRMKSYKVTSDGNTFTKTLSDIVRNRAAES